MVGCGGVAGVSVVWCHQNDALAGWLAKGGGVWEGHAARMRQPGLVHCWMRLGCCLAPETVASPCCCSCRHPLQGCSPRRLRRGPRQRWRRLSWLNRRPPSVTRCLPAALPAPPPACHLSTRPGPIAVPHNTYVWHAVAKLLHLNNPHPLAGCPAVCRCGRCSRRR